MLLFQLRMRAMRPSPDFPAYRPSCSPGCARLHVGGGALQALLHRRDVLAHAAALLHTQAQPQPLLRRAGLSGGAAAARALVR